jgi:hypothetical protein
MDKPTPYLDRSQNHDNHDWVRMINDFWGRNVARIKIDRIPGANMGEDVLVETIVSDQPWVGGRPPQ